MPQQPLPSPTFNLQPRSFRASFFLNPNVSNELPARYRRYTPTDCSKSPRFYKRNRVMAPDIRPNAMKTNSHLRTLLRVDVRITSIHRGRATAHKPTKSEKIKHVKQNSYSAQRRILPVNVTAVCLWRMKTRYPNAELTIGVSSARRMRSPLVRCSSPTWYSRFIFSSTLTSLDTLLNKL